MAARLNKDAVRALYRSRRKAGRCVRCGAPVPDGRSLCLEHRRRQAAYLRRRYRAMAAALMRERG